MGSVLVLNHVGFITHPEVLDIRLVAVAQVGDGYAVPTPAERSRGITVTPFRIGAVAFWAKGPGSEVVGHWLQIVPLPDDVVRTLLAPGGAAFMGFALPVHRTDQPIPAPAVVRIQSAAGGPALAQGMEVVSDLDAYARATLKDEQTRLLTKTIIRAVSKQFVGGILASGAKRQGGDLLGFAVNALASTAATFSEVADTRAWTTLPDHVEATLIDLPPGGYSLTLETRYGTAHLGAVRIVPGRLVVVPVRTFPETVVPSPP
jgi:hypothetical protein